MTGLRTELGGNGLGTCMKRRGTSVGRTHSMLDLDLAI